MVCTLGLPAAGGAALVPASSHLYCRAQDAAGAVQVQGQGHRRAAAVATTRAKALPVWRTSLPWRSCCGPGQRRSGGCYISRCRSCGDAPRG